MDHGMFDMGLGVPGDIAQFMFGEASMQLGMQPNFEPSEVLPEGGPTLHAVQSGKDAEDAVVVDRGVGLRVLLFRLFLLGIAGELR